MNQSRRGFMSLLAAIAAAPAALAQNRTLENLENAGKFGEVKTSYSRGAATTNGGTCGKVLMSDGKGGVSWEDPPNLGRGVTSMYFLDEAGFLQLGKPVYVASPFGRGT